MGFLKQLLKYKNIWIQCHDNPDADTFGSAYGLYCYFKENGIEAKIVYGGSAPVKKSSLHMLMKECQIPITYVKSIPKAELLITVDCHYGAGNVTHFEAENVAIIDHHNGIEPKSELYYIKSNYQSCATVVWELLEEEGFDCNKNENLVTALLYGLYIDTSYFADLYYDKDIKMKSMLVARTPVFEKLTKSNMSLAELMIASDALHNHYFDVERNFAIVQAINCEQGVLGIIGDFIIQVDVISLSVAYTKNDNGYQISIRSYDKPADVIAKYLCNDIGSGGGHSRKAGGRIAKRSLEEKFEGRDVFDVINERLCNYIDGFAKI